MVSHIIVLVIPVEVLLNTILCLPPPQPPASVTSMALVPMKIGVKDTKRVNSSIVDDGPCYMNFGFDRLRYGNTRTNMILRFYEQFWGVPLPQEHISLKNSVHDPNDEEDDEENGGENGGDVLPATPPPIIDTNWTQLLIRAEYLRIYKWVEDMYPVVSYPVPDSTQTPYLGLR
ncbi:hypothetical protein F5887DRAFT_1212414 [Amanita rubescens]|nr:hypothetical protein F5887DRAFT_1212414 [Amanita rubescens]